VWCVCVVCVCVCGVCVWCVCGVCVCVGVGCGGWGGVWGGWGGWGGGGGCYWPYGFHTVYLNVFVSTLRREDNWNLVQVDTIHLNQIQTSGKGKQLVSPKIWGVKSQQDIA